VPERDPWVELLDEGRVREAGAARARWRWLRQAAGEDASVVGTLVDLAERSADAAVATVAGRVHRSVVAAVGADVVVLRPPSGALLLVPLSAVAWVRPGAPPPPAGTRPAPAGPCLLDLLALAAERGDRVALTLAGGTTVTGRLEGVGTDVLRVRPEDAAGDPVYVSATSIREAAVFRSG
jgi:hypothetical protein